MVEPRIPARVQHIKQLAGGRVPAGEQSPRGRVAGDQVTSVRQGQRMPSRSVPQRRPVPAPARPSAARNRACRTPVGASFSNRPRLCCRLSRRAACEQYFRARRTRDNPKAWPGLCRCGRRTTSSGRPEFGDVRNREIANECTPIIHVVSFLEILHLLDRLLLICQSFAIEADDHRQASANFF